MEEKCNNIFAAISPSPTYGLVGSSIASQEGRGQWDVYYTSPQSFNKVFLFVGLTTLGLLMNFYRLMH